ncbi:MAG: PIN domain-containing protein [Candidatus Thermoplasmatota archaeon]
MKTYVDTSAWIALYDRREDNHKSAKETLRTRTGPGKALVTGWHTLVELADGLASHYTQEAAAGELTKLLGSPSLKVLESEPHREAALTLLRTRTGWGVDLSDCLSFAVMEHHRIDTAFSYDADFIKAGFRVVG